MPLPPDIDQRIQSAKARGFTDDQIRADIQRKYGATYAPKGQEAPKPQPALARAAGVSNKFLGTLARFTGLDKAGESLGRLGFQLGRQMGKAAGLDTDRTLKVQPTSGKQVAGDILTLAGTGLNLASAPAGVGRRVAVNALAAGTLGAGESLKEGGSAAQAAGAGAGKAVLAGGATAGLAGLGWLFNKATRDVPVALHKTSTRVPNRTDTEVLLREGVAGNRSQLAQKAQQLVQEAGENIRNDKGAQAATITGEDIWNYEPLQRIREQAKRLGEGDAVDRAIFKVMPKPTGQVAERVPKTLAALRDQIDELVAKGAADDEVAALEREFVNRANRVPVLEALTQRQAIDMASPPSVFTDRATALSSRAEGQVSNAIRAAMAREAPQIVPQLRREAPALALLKELSAYENAKASPVPYGIGNLLQRTILAPGLATRAASAAYKVGAPARAMQSNAVTKAIKRLLERGGVAALGNL